jgi:hypothetical protein
MNQDHIVVWDPEAKYWEGSLVNAQTATQVRGRGGVALPVDASLFALSGVGGYARRAWGAGWPCEATTPRMFCPLTVYLTPEHRRLIWAARVVPDEAHAAKARETGIDGQALMMTSFLARGNTYQASVTPRVAARPMRELGPVDERGGWTIGGEVAIHPSIEGNHAFALYGAVRGARVVWVALTVAR